MWTKVPVKHQSSLQEKEDRRRHFDAFHCYLFQMINDELFPLISDDVIFTPDQVAAISNMDRTPENRTGSGLLHLRRRRSLFTADQIWKLPIFYKVDLSYCMYFVISIFIKLVRGRSLWHKLLLSYVCVPVYDSHIGLCRSGRQDQDQRGS